MEITTGSRLGPYEIVSRIGAGGMGEVFKARDTRLQRSVAIKVLPRSFADDASLRARFEREARVISNLNHPHICTVHDVGQDDGTSFLVMELLEGESLADRLVRGPLPLDDVIRYGAQIADALDRAHRAGIVHRDLKPGNIVITKTGAKLLDFGLARPAKSNIALDAPTEQQPLTSEGTILGTIPYMAPEQLQGAAVDARTDIFAFGAVLYEMIAGRRAFTSTNSASLIAEIIERQPRRISELQPITPPVLEHLITKCLTKDPEQRWQSAFDVGEQLRWIATQSGVAEQVRQRSRERWLPWAWTLAVLAIAIAAFAVWRSSQTTRGRLTKTIISTELDSAWNMAPVISPDGRYVAYPAQHALWLRNLDELEPRKIPIEGEPQPVLFWSPDSKWLIFASGEELWKITPGGTAPVVVAHIPRSIRSFHSGAWGADDRIVLSEYKGGLYEMSARGGSLTQFLAADASLVDFHNLSFLPDGKTLITVPHRLDNTNSVEVIEGTKRQPIVTFDNAVVRGVAYSPTGHLLVSLAGVNAGVWAVPFSATKLRTTGKQFLVQAGAGVCSASNDGSLVYVVNIDYAPQQLVRIDSRGHITPIAAPIDGGQVPLISPDEKRLALTARDDENNRSIHVLDLATGARRQLTSGFWEDYAVSWSHDGRQLLALRSPTNNWNDPRHGIWLIPVDGAGEQRKLVDGLTADFTPDDRTLALLTFSTRDISNVAAMPVTGGAPNPLMRSSAPTTGLALSPDGRFVAYTARDSVSRVWVTRFPTGEGKWQISPTHGAEPRWSADGRSVYFVSDNRFYKAAFDGGGVGRVGEPQLVFDPVSHNMQILRLDQNTPYSLLRDGSIIAFQSLPPTKRQVVLVQNWIEEFR